jgi:hypothetical protein
LLRHRCQRANVAIHQRVSGSWTHSRRRADLRRLVPRRPVRPGMHPDSRSGTTKSVAEAIVCSAPVDRAKRSSTAALVAAANGREHQHAPAWVGRSRAALRDSVACEVRRRRRSARGCRDSSHAAEICRVLVAAVALRLRVRVPGLGDSLVSGVHVPGRSAGALL